MTTYQKRVPIPKPMTHIRKGRRYWVPNIEYPDFPNGWDWGNSDSQRELLASGLCYHTRKGAIARAKAMLMTEEE